MTIAGPAPRWARPAPLRVVAVGLGAENLPV